MSRRRSWTLVGRGAAAGVALLVALLAPSYLDGFHLTIATTAAVYCVCAYGVAVLYSFLGVLNFGIGAFAAVGAYAMAIGAGHGWPLPLAAAFGVLGPAALATALAPLFFRMRGIYFALMTFAFAVLVKETAISWDTLTAGTQGLPFAPADGPIPGVAATPSHLYIATVVIVAVLAVGLGIFRCSRTGRRAIALGGDEPLARSLGIRPLRYQLGISAVSGLVGGVGGILFAYSTGYVVPDTFGSPLSLAAATAVIVGGAAFTIGPIAGAVILIFIPQSLELSPLASSFVYAALLVGAMLFAPGGLMAGIRDLWGTATRGFTSHAARRRHAVRRSGGTA